MAERRMFAKSIVLSDAFLDMPMSARCLYFTLSMFADDDGFVGSPKAIMRQCGASQDDLAILLQKRYVLGFESGVIVIKHWRINNFLRKDRHVDTTYLEELEQLTIDGKGAYTEAENGLVNQRSTNGQPSIGKDRLVQGRLEKDKKEDVVDAREESDLGKIMSFYMENISMGAPSSVVTAAIQSYMEELAPDVVLHAIQQAAERDVHNWTYIKAILDRYKASGLTTLEAVEMDERRTRSARDGEKPVHGVSGSTEDKINGSTGRYDFIHADNE